MLQKPWKKPVDSPSTCFLPRGGTVETEQGRKKVAYNVESEQLETIRSRCLVLFISFTACDHNFSASTVQRKLDVDKT